jgi:hypothetical protein
VAIAALAGTFKKLQHPRVAEGFDAIYRVVIAPSGDFEVLPAWIEAGNTVQIFRGANYIIPGMGKV